MSDALQAAMAAYHDGTLDATGAGLLVTALHGPGGAAVRNHLALDGLLAQAFTADEAVVRSVHERLAAERSASALVKAVRRSLAGQPRRGRRAPTVAWAPRLAVAALLALLIGGGLWLAARPLDPRGECRNDSTAPITVRRGGASVQVPPGGEVKAGDRLALPAKTALKWLDGSRLVFAQESQVELTRPPGALGCHLLVGAVTAEIAPQRPGLPFAITTPETRVEVLGTRFRVVAGTRSTRVDLQEGLVRLTRASDQRVLLLHPDEFAVVAEGQEFVARSTIVAPPPVVPQPPAEPAWKPLFATTGLDGWTPQHGMWSNVHSRVRGHDPHGGKARLLGRHPFGDLELSCRLRITGAEFGEIQVGDYNWFCEIRAKGDEWVQVEVRQRGQELTITADGVALPLQAGDGRPMRAGPLAFYVMPGGTLEIFDARFRIPVQSSAR